MIIDESKKSLELQILEALRDAVNVALRKSTEGIRTGTIKLVESAIYDSKEFKSMLNGKLRGELGLVNARDNFDSILAVWAKSIKVKYIPVTIQGLSLVGGLEIFGIQSNFSDILGKEYTEFISEGAYRAIPGVNYLVEWFKYVALEGDKQINEFYSVSTTFSSRANSRTGDAIMIRSKRGWRVPPEFSGTQNDNFVTRSILEIEKNLYKLIETEITRNIK